MCKFLPLYPKDTPPPSPRGYFAIKSFIYNILQAGSVCKIFYLNGLAAKYCMQRIYRWKGYILECPDVLSLVDGGELFCNADVIDCI
jgi:hypothetical protein